MKRDLVERSMIHECSNHVHRDKTQHETCFALALHSPRIWLNATPISDEFVNHAVL
ncbi:hypothetical protein HMPREF9244_01368 [Alloscardovia omnicolens F0580]|uniref:Uncharacterized protein n=1 Tax=Alloscardovia omnicolens F0580 TaxID=1321816 RepID=U1QR95_9BIFI|nr:hypothetical protein HMPREF9244_01368 [Alloscardovia omnicolens F0580]